MIFCRSSSCDISCGLRVATSSSSTAILELSPDGFDCVDEAGISGSDGGGGGGIVSVVVVVGMTCGVTGGSVG